jgi:hypothetical protein
VISQQSVLEFDSSLARTERERFVGGRYDFCHKVGSLDGLLVRGEVRIDDRDIRLRLMIARRRFDIGALHGD